MVPPEWIERLRKRNEVAGNESGSLVNPLVERVVTVGSRFSPINWTRVVLNLLPVKPDVLAVHKVKDCGKFKELGAKINNNRVDCHMPLEVSNVIVSDTNGRTNAQGS